MKNSSPMFLREEVGEEMLERSWVAHAIAVSGFSRVRRMERKLELSDRLNG